MAALTADRIAARKLRPDYKKEAFVLADDSDPIFANSLVAVLDDGTIKNLPQAITDSDTIVRVLYTDEHIEAGVDTPRSHLAHGETPSFDCLYDIVVYLDAPAAELAAGDEGSMVYAVDDHTVTLTDAGDGTTPLVGAVQKVISATYAAIFVDGLMRDAYVDTTA